MLFRSLITRRLNLEPGEGGIVALLSLSLFLVIGSTAVIGRIVGRSLFLSQLPPQYIPFRYLSVTIGVVLASLVYSRMAGRYRRDRLIQATTLIMIVGLLAFRLLLITPLASNLWMLGSFYVYLEIVMALTLVQFWNFASEIVNTRQAKRLFPSINGAGNLGSILAGASITVLVPWLGTPNLLFILSAALAGYIFLIRVLGQRYGAALDQGEHRHVEEKRGSSGWLTENLHIVRTSPLLVTMAVIVILKTLVVNIVDYQFDLALKQNFSADPSGLSGFLGSFYFWASLAGFFVQMVLYGPVLRRFGIGAALMILPVFILGGSVVILATSAALWAVTLTRSTDTIFRYTVYNTSFSLLYVPIESRLRSRARALLSGVLEPLSVSLAGILFFVMNNLTGLSVLPFSVAVILVVLLMMFALLRLRPLYLETLQTSIRRRYFDPAGESINLTDLNTVKMVKNALQHSDEAQILHALGLATEIPGVNWSESLLPLLESAYPLVRRQALRLLRTSGNARHAERVYRLMDDPDSGVKASAVYTYWVLRGEAAFNEMRSLMQHTQPDVQAAAVIGALLYGDPEGRSLARATLKSMAVHPDSSVRTAAAYALGELPNGHAGDLLSGLVQDPDSQVRQQAIRSAGRLADETLVPILLPHLSDPRVGVETVEALAQIGEPIFTDLESWYTEFDQNLEVRRQIPHVLARIQSPESLRFLVRHLNEPDDLTRARLYLALGRLHRAGLQLGNADLVLIENQLVEEARIAYQWSIHIYSLLDKYPGSLLEDALSWRQRYAIDRLLYLISFLYPQINIAQLRANLFGSEPRLKANAIELLDTVLSRSQKEILLPFLEGSPARIMETAELQFGLLKPDLQPVLAEFIESKDTWLAACSLHSLTSQPFLTLKPNVRQSLSSQNALVREAAVLASIAIFPENEYKDILLSYTDQEQEPDLLSFVHTWLQVPNGDDNGGIAMPITTLERVLLLRGVELFKEIPGQELELIARLCQEVYFSPGERFIYQGDYSDSLYILVDGEVEVSIDGVGAVSMLRERDVLGEIGVLANNRRTASCTAVSPTTALRIDQADFWDLIERNLSLSVGVIRVLVPMLLQRSTSNNLMANKTNPNL